MKIMRSERTARNDPWYDREVHGPKDMLPYRLFGNVYWQGLGWPIIWDKWGNQEQKDRYGMHYNTVKQENDWAKGWSDWADKRRAGDMDAPMPSDVVMFTRKD